MELPYTEPAQNFKIDVIGVGQTGLNAIEKMIDSNHPGIRLIVADTDRQALAYSRAQIKIELMKKPISGFYEGGDPYIGEKAAEESREKLKQVFVGSHVVIIVAGIGGGTGTGAAPIIAEICKNVGSLTIAVVTKPFGFESKKRSKIAEEWLERLKKLVDTVIIIPNDRLSEMVPKKITFSEIFKKSNETIYYLVNAITDFILGKIFFCHDFNDVKRVMTKAGIAVIGIGTASGKDRVIKAVERATSYPLFGGNFIANSKSALINITSNSDLMVDELMEVCKLIYQKAGDNNEIEILCGTTINDDIGDQLRITVIATGLFDNL